MVIPAIAAIITAIPAATICPVFLLFFMPLMLVLFMLLFISGAGVPGFTKPTALAFSAVYTGGTLFCAAFACAFGTGSSAYGDIV